MRNVDPLLDEDGVLDVHAGWGWAAWTYSLSITAAIFAYYDL